MKFRFFLGIVLMSVLLFSCSANRYELATERVKDLPEFNRIVLETMKKYPTDGTHGYWWPRGGEGSYDGCTRDLYLDGKRVMKGEPKHRSYCCGMTLEVFLEAYKTWLKEHGGDRASMVSPDKWRQFESLWFVREVNGPGPSAALEEFKLGRTIEPNEALPGDFIQIWRTLKEGRKSPSGHSVIFLDWVKDNGGKVTGIKYWSSQPGTDGIGERVEHFGPNGGIAGVNTHFGRVEPRAKKVKPAPVKKAVKKPEPEKKKKPAPGKKTSSKDKKSSKGKK